jgi:hypothetical protein
MEKLTFIDPNHAFESLLLMSDSRMRDTQPYGNTVLFGIVCGCTWFVPPIFSFLHIFKAYELQLQKKSEDVSVQEECIIKFHEVLGVQKKKFSNGC